MKGKTPQVGDRVLVEAVYNPNMPFKWNAQRIQTLPQLPNPSVWIFSACILLLRKTPIWVFCLKLFFSTNTNYIFKTVLSTYTSVIFFCFQINSFVSFIDCCVSILPSISSSLRLYLKLPHSSAAFTMNQGCRCATQTFTPLRTTDQM